MRLASSRDDQNLLNLEILPTPQIFEEGISLLIQAAQRITNGEKIESIAGGIAGPLDSQHTMMVKSGNLADWAQKPIKKHLEQVFNTTVFLENDAGLGGLGEATYGAGKGFKIVTYLTISTGVGGSRIVNGKIDQNTLGFEPGHQIISLDETILQDYISGKALYKRNNIKPEQITDPKVWDEVARLLAIGLNNTIVHWSPEVVVLGGSVMKSIDIEKVRSYLDKILEVFVQKPEIKRAELEEKAGLYGGLAYLKSLS